MDNNNNNFDGFIPQKPFTDKSTEQTTDNNTAQAQNTTPDDTTPVVENLCENNCVNNEQQCNPQNFNNYSDGFNQSANTQNFNGNYYNPNQTNQPNTYPTHNNYSNPQYANYDTNNAQQTCNNAPNYAQPNQPINQQPNSQSYYQQPYNAPQNNYQQMPYSYPPQPVKPPKKPMGKGLLALIIVICILLSSSLTGIGVYVALNSSNNNSQNRDSIFAPSQGNEYTLPRNTTPQDEQSTPQSNHSESDYSKKTMSDFSGIKLESKPKDATTNKDYTSEYAFNKVSSSVVGIVCYSDTITTVENCDSQGSGIIITSDGYVVTNAHVINNSKTAYLIQIVTADGKKYNAGVVGFDTRTDIAVLKMDDAKNLQPATFANSKDIELGEDIIVVGNPGGLDYQNSITKGIVSAVDRSLSSTSLVKYIQTDAAINPGNSGGPIVNLYGQVIGIATSKIVADKYEGMGFAIPSYTAKDIIDSLVKNSYVNGRVKIGITGSAISESLSSTYNVPSGILIQSITSGGPCDGTALQKNDIITSFDGKKISSFSDIYEILETHKAGDKVKIKYYDTTSNKENTIEITLQEDK